MGTEAPPLRPGAPARALIAQAERLRAAATEALAEPAQRREAARAAYEQARDATVQEQLAHMPVDRLRETTEGRLRLGPVTSAGITTVAAVLSAGVWGLDRLPGIGRQSAAQIVGAARQLQVALTDSLRLRFDADTRPTAHAELLGALAAVEAADAHIGPLEVQLRDLSDEIASSVPAAARARSRLRMFFTGQERRAEAVDALTRLDQTVRSADGSGLMASLDEAAAAVEEAASSPTPSLWADYERRAARFNGLLIDVVGQASDTEAAQGYVPSAVAEQVTKHPLDTSLLGVSLRGYQAFGARFALSRRRAILGDEMGLGKTIEALAAMCHLSSEGATHFLVVCPASVIVNWAHEVERHSQLSALRLHGADRARNVKLWERRGGVAITTFDALRSLEPPTTVDLAMLVVDEAHYVKNPEAKRTQAVVRWAEETDRVLFLSGTPMENRVEEFRTLVGHLSPEVAASICLADGVGGATAFRMAVAGSYLRRNQDDVLTELPPRIESQDWVQLSGEDLASYREAVASGNFMAMRRAAYAPGTISGSAKLARLVEVAHEALADGRKVVVFSYFLDVLNAVSQTLGHKAIGPITGAVVPAARQQLIDEFTARRAPAVLVSQIESGGVGLNIQAASVVILAEPQWKPSTEEQAIARSHRMGQARTVDVHRILGEDTVDQHMRHVLARKGLLFDEYVRRSDLKDSTPDAVDVSDVQAVQAAASQAEDERRIIELERRRLGLEAPLTTREAVNRSTRPGHSG